MSKDSVIILLVFVASIWWAMFIWMWSSVGTISDGIDRLRWQTIELRDITNEKCLDLLLNN